MFKATHDGCTNFYCACVSTRTYEYGICETCGGVEPPPADIVSEMRGFADDHEPDGWPAVRMRQITALCDEADNARAMLRAEWDEKGEAATLAAAAELRRLHGEIEQLRLAEEGAKEAFGHVVQQKRDLEAECKRLRGLLDGAYETIRRHAVTHNVELTGAAAALSRSDQRPKGARLSVWLGGK